jgi:hypothetical protein
MTKVKGRFYFKQTSNGNLLGEFSNSGSQSWTESADATGSTTCNFVGSYQSSWQESGASFFAELTIAPKANCHNLFSLEWKRSGTLIFKGEAMLCDDILVGDYQSIH